MKKLFTTIGFLMLLVLPLQVYNIPLGFINLSVDRILLISCLALLPFYLRYFDKDILVIVFLLLSSTTMSLLMADNLDLLMKFFPSWLQSILVFVIAFILAKKRKFSFCLVHLSHSYLLIFFVLYSFFYLYIVGTVSFSYPLSQFLPNFEEDSHKLSQLYNLRVFFPFSAAPRLGFVLGFLFLAIPIKKYYSNSKENTINSLIGFFLIVGVVLTISRGPLVSLIFALFIYYLFVLKSNYKIGVKYSLYILIAILFITYLLNNYVPLERIKFERLLSFGMEDASFEGHANVRMRALVTIFTSPFLNSLFGYGIGHSQDVLGVSSVHSSYFTIMLEQGIAGFIAYTSIYILMLYSSIKLYLISKKSGYQTKVFIYLITISVYLSAIHIVYDATTLVILWAYNGIILGIIKYETNRIKHYNTNF